MAQVAGLSLSGQCYGLGAMHYVPELISELLAGITCHIGCAEEVGNFNSHSYTHGCHHERVQCDIAGQKPKQITSNASTRCAASAALQHDSPVERFIIIDHWQPLSSQWPLSPSAAVVGASQWKQVARFHRVCLGRGYLLYLLACTCLPVPIQALPRWHPVLACWDIFPGQCS
jgi:hypothetical protein